MYRCFKRIFDFVSALMLFCIISPLFLLIWLLVRIKLGSPVFFTQKRSGMQRKVFHIIKFRTMTDDKDEHGKLLPDEQRLTTLGQWLRSTSLDELPELLSIIKGDMSVIGPRPLPSIYSERELKRFEVRSGLIPPDSTEESAIISWDKQLECEASYAENLSLINDIRIFISTIRIVRKRNAIDYGSYIRLPLNEERVSWNTQHN